MIGWSANMHIPTKQGAQCTWKSVYHHPHTLTHTHTYGVAVLPLLIPFISLSPLLPPPHPPSFQEQGAGSHLLIGFAEETYSLDSFSLIPQGSLPLRWFPCLLLLPTQPSVHEACYSSARCKTAELQGLRGRKKKKKKKKTIPRPVVQSVGGWAAVALHLSYMDIIYDSVQLLRLMGLEINTNVKNRFEDISPGRSAGDNTVFTDDSCKVLELQKKKKKKKKSRQIKNAAFKGISSEGLWAEFSLF